MTTCVIKGIPIRFPFEPYQIQKDYMEKVIECLQNNQNGVLESPTGTGKTLSLLCSSLAWLEVKKAQLQAQRSVAFDDQNNDFLKNLQQKLNEGAGKSQKSGRAFLGIPTVIYASRTHSQLSQAMQELKRTAYNHMKATVIGSREQMCIHSDILKEENNSMKLQLCRMKVKTRSCQFFNRVERKKEDPAIMNLSVTDIEDIVKLGQSHRFCPYYMAKELKQHADIVFMPYNYLLDPRARKVFGVDLANSIIILDEAHNVEKMCEDSASLQIKSTDITLCIEEVTTAMKALSEDATVDFNDQDVSKDFNAEELCILKQMLLEFEKILDDVPLKSSNPEDTNFEGSYIFEMLQKAGIHDGNFNSVLTLIDNLVQFLTTANEGVFQRRGNGLQLFADLLTIAFGSVSPTFKDKIKRCYKVHITSEEPKKRVQDNWLSKATAKARTRVLSYWCFSPGFGMNMLINQGVHCVILTSGTLAPLKPLISELELNVNVRIENPHIVKSDQVCVKILTKGPDNEPLNCNFQNRDNPNYLRSLGQVISNLIRVIPGGVLIFFPSYPIMQKCQQYWQETGIWSAINQQKQIYVEPRDKISFNTAMNDYYSKIQDPNYKGAIFMGVCRGKVSEGLDFADMNGRAVFITGLPYPPLKDPRVILKKRYLDACNSKDREYLRGNEWYSLEATRAINQAMGRVIRHKDDYGAIILLDSRFTNPQIKNNMSMWLREHIKTVQNFGEMIRDLRGFFQVAQEKQPKPIKIESVTPKIEPAEFEIPPTRKYGNFNFSTSSISLGASLPASTSSGSNDGLVTIHKRNPENSLKRKRITVVPNPKNNSASLETSTKEYIVMVKKALDSDAFKQFLNAMTAYKANTDIKELTENLDEIFVKRYHVRYIIPGLEPYIKDHDKDEFSKYCQKMQ